MHCVLSDKGDQHKWNEMIERDWAVKKVDNLKKRRITREKEIKRHEIKWKIDNVELRQKKTY